MSEVKNILDGINERLGVTQKNIIEFEDMAIENIQSETEKKR